jgi:hypothetical protein
MYFSIDIYLQKIEFQTTSVSSNIIPCSALMDILRNSEINLVNKWGFPTLTLSVFPYIRYGVLCKCWKPEVSEGRQTIKYVSGSRGAGDQDSFCWRGRTEIKQSAGIQAVLGDKRRIPLLSKNAESERQIHFLVEDKAPLPSSDRGAINFFL